MAITDKFKKGESLFSTTLQSGIGTGTGDTITLGSTTGLPTDTEITLTFDRVDSNGTDLGNQVERITGTISGSTLTAYTRGTDGTTEQAHSASAVIEYVFNSQDWNDTIDGILVGHTQAGLHDLNGGKMILDADADTSITADTDDQIDLELGGSDRFRFKTADMDLVTSTANIQVAGADPKRAIYVPANAMFPATTNGCAALAQYESTTNKNNMKYLAFDSSSDEYAHFSIPSPSNWDAGTVTAKFYWTTESGSAAETVEFAIQGVATANDDTLDVAYGTKQEASDTWSADNDLHISPATSAMTIAGSPTAGEWLDFRIYRDVSEDDLGGDAWLLGVRIEFGIAQYNDA